jgi:hypothetical protein
MGRVCFGAGRAGGWRRNWWPGSGTKGSTAKVTETTRARGIRSSIFWLTIRCTLPPNPRLIGARVSTDTEMRSEPVSSRPAMTSVQ